MQTHSTDGQNARSSAAYEGLMEEDRRTGKKEKEVNKYYAMLELKSTIKDM